MFDNLREQANAAPFSDDEAKFQPADSLTAAPLTPGRFLGMTGQQRFILSLLVMVAVCVLGTMCLLVTGKVLF